jgi:hypothetical protein
MVVVSHVFHEATAISVTTRDNTTHRGRFNHPEI